MIVPGMKICFEKKNISFIFPQKGEGREFYSIIKKLSLLNDFLLFVNVKKKKEKKEPPVSNAHCSRADLDDTSCLID